MSQRQLFAALFAIALIRIAGAADAMPPPWLPSNPGKANCHITQDGGELSNAALRFAVASHDGMLVPAAFDNRFTGATHALSGKLFVVMPRGTEKDASKRPLFKLDGRLSCATLKAKPDSVRAADRFAGVALDARMVDSTSGMTVHWQAQLRHGANYVREEIRLESPQDIDLARVTLIDLDLAGAASAGIVQGSPVLADDRFFGFEHALAEVPRVESGHTSIFIKRALPLRAHVATSYSAVLGVAPHEQMRRAFLAYIERERAHPFRTFLHYNSWYDIGYFTPYTDKDALRVIDAYGQNLVRERGVKMDSFLFDDGWDDYKNLWQFNSGFPNGFAPLKQAAAKYDAAPGMWLSPWGGYSTPHDVRVATAKAAGYEIGEQGLALSGPKYYKLFHDVTRDLLKRYGVNQFKLDGTGSADKVVPGSAFDSDFAAAIALIEDLRADKPDLFINLTTGTWPSPFWLRTADSIWRGGEDHSFAGVGSDRQRWITYRDADTYGGIVRQGPLYPLNSLMLHGIIYARHAHALNVNPNPEDFRAEVQSYFATGTALQEMYISPDLLTPADWGTLAASAKWARERAAVLRDSHWIGGDPIRGEVYGWASWSPEGAVIALRNPSDKAQEFRVDLRAALELPERAASSFHATSPYDHADARDLDAGQPATITLQPFQVLVWDLAPVAAKH